MKNRGVSLLEMVIVLVVIGILTGSVIMGRQAIVLAKVKRVLEQYNEFQTAFNLFTERYSGIPGDLDGDSVGLDGGCNGAANQGDGDFRIEDSAGTADGTTAQFHDAEIACFWSQLSSENLEFITGSYDGFEDPTNSATVGDHMPRLRYGNEASGWGVFSIGRRHYLIAGVQTETGATPAYNVSNLFTPIDALALDQKIDDGQPNGGFIRARNGAENGIPNSPPTTNTGASDTACLDDSTPLDTYQGQDETPQCALRFEIQNNLY